MIVVVSGKVPEMHIESSLWLKAYFSIEKIRMILLERNRAVFLKTGLLLMFTLAQVVCVGFASQTKS